jgi:hypothetical protein
MGMEKGERQTSLGGDLYVKCKCGAWYDYVWVAGLTNFPASRHFRTDSRRSPSAAPMAYQFAG